MRQVRLTTVLRGAAVVLLAACSSSEISGPGPDPVVTLPKRNPVFFIHGYNSTGATWFTMIDRLKADGYKDAELYNWTYDSGQSNAATAQQIAAKVDSILSVTGAKQVDIITHSMGAISARYYIKNLGGTGKVDAYISLAGTNHGTSLAVFCSQISCVEMRPNSTYLTALNSDDETPGTPRYFTWWSSCDEAINPVRSAILSDATNTETACIKHSDLHEDATVYSQIKGSL